MIKLKKLLLSNFCGYRGDNLFDFTDPSTQKIALFIGPNGEGKSSILNAISLVCSADQYMSRSKKDCQVIFRKLTYHANYDATLHEVKLNEGLEEKSEEMFIESLFQTNAGDKSVIITTDGVQHNGFFSDKGLNTHSVFVDANNPTRMRRFQIREEDADVFLDIAEASFGRPCRLEKKMDHGQGGDSLVLYTDFVIEKTRKGFTDHVHFGRMSDGEKKVATFIRYMLKDEFKAVDIAVVDNLDLHVYYKYQGRLIDKMVEHFPDTQFFITAHHPTMIDHVKDRFGEQAVFDIEEIVS